MEQVLILVEVAKKCREIEGNVDGCCLGCGFLALYI